jgi:hypothetical protein
VPSRLRAAVLGLALACGSEGVDSPRSTAVRVETGALSEQARALLENEIALLKRESGISFYIRSLRAADATWMATPGADPLGEIDRARDPDPRRLLLAYSAPGHDARLDLGYAIEPFVSDALAGFWLDEHVVPLLRADRADAALELAIRMFADRARHALFSELSEMESTRVPARYSGGGGGARSLPATLSAPGGSRTRNTEWQRADSAEAAYQQYLDWLEAGDPALRPRALTPASRRLLAEWPLTPGYMDHVYAREVGRSFAILERGDRALLVFRDDPFLAPHFFAKAGDGWQMCIATEAAEVVNMAGGDYSWSFRRSDRKALRPFARDLVDVGIARRIRGGDNRPSTRGDRASEG